MLFRHFVVPYISIPNIKRIAEAARSDVFVVEGTKSVIQLHMRNKEHHIAIVSSSHNIQTPGWPFFVLRAPKRENLNNYFLLSLSKTLPGFEPTTYSAYDDALTTWPSHMSILWKYMHN